MKIEYERALGRYALYLASVLLWLAVIIAINIHSVLLAVSAYIVAGIIMSCLLMRGPLDAENRRPADHKGTTILLCLISGLILLTLFTGSMLDEETGT